MSNEKKITRRETLGLMGAAALAVTVGCGDDDNAPSGSTSVTPEATVEATTAAGTTGASATATQVAAPTNAAGVPLSCVLTPEQTEGPYFVDELLNRSDIRPDPTTGVVSEGVPLRLNMSVTSVAGDGTCAPLQGAVVDMWQCDAFGAYSDVSGAGQDDQSGKKYLRGYQVADADGQVSFVTVYPGWYQGRTVHIHFKVRETVDASQEFNSQLYFDEAVTDEVYQLPPYNTRGDRDQSNATDGIYQVETLIAPVLEGDGYVGQYAVGVSLA